MSKDERPDGAPTPSRWRRITALFHEAVARPPAARSAFLDDACAGDTGLRRDVDELVTAHRDAGSFGSAPLFVPAEHLPPGSWLGPYRIERLVDTGGMGEVYRARDTKLERDVAIKVLPADLADDPERMARFAREARLLGALNHSNIAAIHGLEDSGQVHGLVLEWIEGKTLAARLARGAVPLADAIGLACQIAEALEAAHARGIVHRDLKPANVMIAAGAKVKVLDFGLAKSTDMSDTSPPAGLSAPAVIVGTAPYMSPEQARGLPVDKRTDIWAFGCVLYEMLAGKPAFDGASPADILAAVASREPDLDALPPAVPGTVRTLIARCLRKDPAHRLRDAGDARLELLASLDRRVAHPPASPRRVAWRHPGALIVVAVSLVALAWWVATRRADAVAATDRLSFAINPPDGVLWGNFPPDPQAVASPDGLKVAFVGRSPEGFGIWVRRLSAVDARLVAASADWPNSVRGPAAGLFWSADSTRLAYCVDGRFKIVSVEGGPPRTLESGCVRGDGSWNSAGEILLMRDDGIYRMPERGGAATRETSVERGRDVQHRYPRWLPDGRRFIYTVLSGDPQRAGIYLGTIGQPGATRLLDTPSRADYVTSPDGRPSLVFVRHGRLVAQSLDPSSLVPRGEPVQLADAMAIGPAGNPAFSATDTLLVHRSGGTSVRSSWVSVDRLGRRQDDRFGMEMSVAAAALTPDESTLVYARRNQDTMLLDLWTVDLARGVERPLLVLPYLVDLPAVSPDGKRLAFIGGEGGRLRTYTMDLPAGRPARLATQRSVTGPQWTPDGDTLIGTEGGNVVVAVPVENPGQQVLLVDDASQPHLSPDGRWLAYSSLVSGVPDVYVQRYRGGDGDRPVRISRDGGFQPQWRGDGSELYYLTEAGDLMAVPVRAGTQFEAGPATRLFRERFVPEGASYLRRDYLATRNGQRFMLNLPSAGTVPLTAVRHWLSPGR